MRMMKLFSSFLTANENTWENLKRILRTAEKREVLKILHLNCDVFIIVVLVTRMRMRQFLLQEQHVSTVAQRGHTKHSLVCVSSELKGVQLIVNNTEHQFCSFSHQTESVCSVTSHHCDQSCDSKPLNTFPHLQGDGGVSVVNVLSEPRSSTTDRLT